MKRIINRMFGKLGYVKYDPFKELLHELVKESLRREGELITCAEMGLRIRIQATEDFI